jgi:hypothetical protein
MTMEAARVREEHALHQLERRDAVQTHTIIVIDGMLSRSMA